MAVRILRKFEDEALRRVAKPVDKIDEHIKGLVKDMADTMYEHKGVGLAAPQIGISKRVVVIDVGEGLLQLINPKIVKQEGEEIDVEGCLSFPGVYGEVKRPYRVVVEALNLQGEKIKIEGEGLLARALCHEIDHLNGIVFIDKAVRFIDEDTQANE